MAIYEKSVRALMRDMVAAMGLESCTSKARWAAAAREERLVATVYFRGTGYLRSRSEGREWGWTGAMRVLVHKSAGFD